MMTRNRTGKLNRQNKILWGALLVLLAIFALAPKKDRGEGEKAEAAAPSLTIQEIHATGDRVTVQATRSLVRATPYFLGDPIRLMIDFKGAAVADGVPTSIPVNGDLIQTVQLTTLPGNGLIPSTVRLELDLAQDAGYQLQPNGKTLVVVLTPRQVKTPTTFPEDVYNQAKTIEQSIYTTGRYTPPPSGIQMPKAGEQMVVTRPGPIEMARPAPPPGPPLVLRLPTTGPAIGVGRATRVVNILHRSNEQRFQFLIKTDGPVGNYEPSTRSRPNRLVVDLPGLTEQERTRVISIGVSGIRRVRVGSHPDKTRVVFDFSGPIPAYTFTPAKMGLIVTLTTP